METEPRGGKKKNETDDIAAKQSSRKPQLNRIIPEKMLNSGANRNNTKMTGNETQPNKQ